MASGFQTIANQGLHHEPYFVDFVAKPDGTRVYTHEVAGTQVLVHSAALIRAKDEATFNAVNVEGAGAAAQAAAFVHGRCVAGQFGGRRVAGGRAVVGHQGQQARQVRQIDPLGDGSGSVRTARPAVVQSSSPARAVLLPQFPG